MSDDPSDTVFDPQDLYQWCDTCQSTDKLFETKSIQLRSFEDWESEAAKPRDISFDLADKDRRKTRMKRKAVIPAGYTYFGQLIGHDIGNSVRLDSVPHSTKKTLGSEKDAQSMVRYNLIENPLTLETIYGPGPTLMHHVFDPDTFLFRVNRNRMTSLVFNGPDGSKDNSVRAIYDSRNRDTTFLHRLSVILMKFHNYLALDLRRATGQTNWNDRMLIYTQTRAHVVAVWHDLIRNDFLGTFVDQTTLPQPIQNMPELDETTLLHGVFRAFHALPRSHYFMDQQNRPLKRILRGKVTHKSEADSWGLSWENFFTDTPKGTKTGLSASVSPSLTSRNGLALSKQDLVTAKNTGPLRLGSDTIKQVVSLLAPSDAAQLDPGTFAKAVNEDFGVLSGPAMMDAEAIDWMPLFATLMLEAELHGTEGRFGPLGGLILTHMIEELLQNVVVSADPSEHLPRMSTMYEIIQYVEEKEKLNET